MGYEEGNDNSPLGITISMAGKPKSFYSNIFCSKIENPILGWTKCFEGLAECRVSASLYNHKISLKGGKPLLGLGRRTGFALNQSMVESAWGKCSYIWDGASANRYNRGCGNGAPGDCNSKQSAFHNVCLSTGKECTADAQEVTRALCTHYGGDTPIPPTHDGYPQCFFPGPALDYREQDGYKPGQDATRDMVRNRIALNSGHDVSGPNLEKWNEVVVDDLLLLPAIQFDPASAIPAFIYTKSDIVAKMDLKMMRDEFCEKNKVAKIPIIALNDQDVLKAPGPFEALPEDEEDEDAAAYV